MQVFTPAFVVQLPLRSLASLLDTTRMLRFIALPARLARAMMVDALRLLAAPRGAIRVEAMRSLAFTALMQVVVVAFRHLPHLRILASLVEATISLLFLMAILALLARAIIALRKVARFVFWKGGGTRRRRPMVTRQWRVVVTRRRPLTQNFSLHLYQ